MFRSLMCAIFLASLAVNCLAQDATTQQIRREALVQKARAALARGHMPTEIRDFGQSESEAKIRAAFDIPTTEIFLECPLEEVCDLISDTHKIPILLDRRALEEAGLTSDTPVNVDVKNISLRSLLRLIGKDLDLTYVVADEVLQITTIKAAERNLATKMLKLDQSLWAEKVDLVAVIQKNVAPTTWEPFGGPSSMLYLDNILVISATEDVINQVEVIISKLTKLRKQRGR